MSVRSRVLIAECSQLIVHKWVFTDACSRIGVHSCVFTNECSPLSVHSYIFTVARSQMRVDSCMSTALCSQLSVHTTCSSGTISSSDPWSISTGQRVSRSFTVCEPQQKGGERRSRARRLDCVRATAEKGERPSRVRISVVPNTAHRKP